MMFASPNGRNGLRGDDVDASWSAGGYALRFSGSKSQKPSDAGNTETIEVTNPVVNGRPVLRLSVADARADREYEVRYDGENVDGAAACIAGQSVFWHDVRLYRPSDPERVIAKWALGRDYYRGQLIYDISIITSILKSLQVHKFEKK